MRAVNLKVQPFQFLSYLDVEYKKKLDDHGILRIRGVIDGEKAAEYRRLSVLETWVSLSAEGSTLFSGVLTNFGIQEEGEVNTMTIEVRTGSFLLDLTPHIKSFQEKSLTYKQVIDTCLAEEGGQISISVEDESRPIGNFLLQYKETNWEFIKRMAHNAGTVIMPEFNTMGRRIHFGVLGRTPSGEIAEESYSMDRVYEEYGASEEEQVKSLANPDFGVYKVKSREVYELGNMASFQGISYLIGEINSCLVGEELLHEYSLMFIREMPQINRNHKTIRGLSLKANITKVKRDEVQVDIQVDENIGNSGYCWFDYATVYSTPDGTGWYCMPEIGDEVRLTFPDAYEQSAYVASSVHLDTAGGRSDPDKKSWKNKQQKEILFTPDTLILRNNKGLIVELSDQEGIKIISNKEIMLQAKKDITISSDLASVNIQGLQDVNLTQGCAQISIADDINIGGGKINMN